MTTALDLIEAAMSKINVLAAGETPSAEDAAVGLERLNSLMTALEIESMFNRTTTDTVFSLPANTPSQTIGPAQQIAMVAPVKVLKGSFGRIGGVDYPITPISEAEYNAISLKSSFGSVAPAVCFYDGGSPTGIVYFWPVASAVVEVHLVTPAAGGVAVSTSTTYDFAPGEQRMVENCLAIELAPDFNTEAPASVVRMASSAKRMLKRANYRTPQLDIDVVTGHGASVSDFYAGY